MGLGEWSLWNFSTEKVSNAHLLLVEIEDTLAGVNIVLYQTPFHVIERVV